MPLGKGQRQRQLSKQNPIALTSWYFICKINTMRLSVKESLILHYQPELLGGLAKIPALKGRDRASIEEALRQARLRSEAAQAVSDGQFPIDFHLYRICTKRGMIEFAVERRWGLISCSYSGSKEEMKRLKAIYRDVYLYYGVTEEDIRNQTDRYQELVSVLAI